MKIITAPSKQDPRDYFDHDFTVFVAGGISGCPDWQQEFLSKFSVDDPILFLNPRRNDFDITNPNESVIQIKWECENIDASETMIFWFPEETLCPITLYELGKAMGGGHQDIFVGCHPGYKRRLDVVEQLKYMDPDGEVVDSIDALARQLKDHCGIL